MPGYHQVLIRRDYANETLTVINANHIGVGFIPFELELDAEVLQANTSLPPHRSGSFANTAGENQKIESAQHGGERADLLS